MSSRRATGAQRIVQRPQVHASVPVVAGLQRSVWRLQGFLGRHLSIRWKLTLWYGVMCALTLGILGFGMKWTLERYTQATIDSNLANTGARLAPALQTASPDYTVLGSYEAFVRYQGVIRQKLFQYSDVGSAPGVFEQVQLSQIGSMVNAACLVSPRSSKCNQGGVFLGLVAAIDVVPKVATTRQPAYMTVTDKDQTYRVYLTPLTPPPQLQNQVIGVLEVIQAEKTYIDIRNSISLLLLLGIPFALLVALVAGWWIARAALRPIDRISRTVRTIGESRDLSNRLHFVGPINDEIGQLALTFDHMMDRLEKSFETQKRFIADASHELRTPLTAIRGNAELLSIAPPQEREQCIASIRREAERMSRLVNDLLLLAAADVEEHPFHMQEVDLPVLLTDVYRSARVLAGDRVAVILDAERHAMVQGDADRLKQLFLNLVDNAVKFTPDDGVVSVRLLHAEGGYRIEVADTGMGIAPEEQEAIFRRFYRVEQARTRRGSGLGLSICAWIVSGHGGTIDVSSIPGEGSTFTVFLPAKVSTPEASENKAAVSVPAE